jgi:hypothetical protein
VRGSGIDRRQTIEHGSWGFARIRDRRVLNLAPSKWEEVPWDFIARRSVRPADKCYTVSGKTLDEINKDMAKKGPPDPEREQEILGLVPGQARDRTSKPKDIEHEVKSNGGKFAAIARTEERLHHQHGRESPRPNKWPPTRACSGRGAQGWNRFLVVRTSACTSVAMPTPNYGHSRSRFMERHVGHVRGQAPGTS